jgi:hypothetical protein
MEDGQMKRNGHRLAASALAIALLLAVLSSAGCSGVKELSDVLGTATSSGTAASRGVVEQTAPEQAPSKYAGAAGTAEGAPDQATAGPTLAGPLIIKNKTMRIEVKAVKAAVDEIRSLASKHGGSITGLNVATDDEPPIYRPEAVDYTTGSQALRGWVTVRVPVDAYEAFVTDVSAIGTVKSQSESAEDVTQQHVDLKARLDNLRAEEKRLREFFAAAKNVDEMLAVERELSRVRGEIESLDAQVQYLERQAAMATVTIELTEPQPIIRPQGESWGFLDAITTGFRGAAATIKILIVVALTLLPLVVLAAALFYAVRATVRRRRARKAAAASENDLAESDLS